MPYITILGAGSAMFARQLMTDILQIERLDEGCFALVDIDPSRLELAHQLAERLITQSGKRWSVRASTERRDLLAGSDFIINSIEVAGLANVRHDFDIPMKIWNGAVQVLITMPGLQSLATRVRICTLACANWPRYPKSMSAIQSASRSCAILERLSPRAAVTFRSMSLTFANGLS